MQNDPSWRESGSEELPAPRLATLWIGSRARAKRTSRRVLECRGLCSHHWICGS